MKLLLTSAGISNKSIVKSLESLLPKKITEANVVFVPTAANLDLGDKKWLEEDLDILRTLNFKDLSIVDIAKIDEIGWNKIKLADILYFEGGDNYYLMEQMNKSGLTKLLPDLLKDKVYIGVSAGSMVLSKDMPIGIAHKVYEEDLDRDTGMEGLGFVDFYFLPHLNSAYFSSVRENIIREEVADYLDKIYVLDDESALIYNDGKIGIVSEGKYFIIN